MVTVGKVAQGEGGALAPTLAVWLWASGRTSLCLSLSIRKMELIIIPASQVVVKIFVI